jgi:multidrug transporter EmrE-like cation transporter
LSKLTDDTDAIVDIDELPAGASGRKRVSLLSLALLLFAVGSAAVGQLLLKHGMVTATKRVEESKGSLAVAAATSPWVLLGLTVFAVSAVAWLITLSKVPLSLAYPFNALGYLAILTASVVVLNERANVWTWLGTSCVVAGLIIVVTTKPA